MSSQLITELMRLYVLNSEYEKSYNILTKALSKNIIIGDMHKRKCFFGNRMIGEALATFKDINLAKSIKSYYLDIYSDELVSLSHRKSVVLLSIYGPGDEIRFASIYEHIREALINVDLKITCTPRLKNIFIRSFPDINFIGVDRPRGLDFVDLKNYSLVPGSDIHSIIDNNAAKAINAADGLSLVSSMLSEVLTDYASFKGKSYLQVDKSLQASFFEKTKKIKSKKLVGISWRSSLTTSARNEHYLSIEDLDPLFQIEGVQFINLQYDECKDELKKINDKYPNKIINFDELDQYNDFDGVAALMSCLDLIISPATTVVELAGAVGIATWLFSNSSEIDWRKTNEQGTDVWHNSITIVDIPEKGNKKKLVEEIHHRLELFTKKY